MAWEGSTRRARLPPGWSSTVVPRILARDRGICHECHHAGADEVDHIVAGDDHSDANLGAIHGSHCPTCGVKCHARKTAQEGNASRHRVKASRPAEPHPGLLP